MLDTPLSVQIAEWRRKEAAGELTTQDMIEVVKAVRAGRISAAQTSAKSRASKAPIDVKSLENEFDV